MKEIVIVGAGLAGLAAAVILAREGRDVTVMEQKKAIGGATRWPGASSALRT